MAPRAHNVSPTVASEVQALPDIAYRWLRDAILGAAFESGHPLRQEELAHTLGISRIPLREALKQLEADGLVTQRPRRGYVVASLDPEEIADIFDIRMMLEERAGYLATLKRTEQDIAAVETLLAAMDGAAIRTPADIDGFAARNREFHSRLFAASGRRQLCHLMIVLRNNVERYIRVGMVVAGDMRRAHDDHRSIVEAFRRGDAEEVGRLCREHCRSTCERLLLGLHDRRHGAADDRPHQVQEERAI
jgi:DNA-binding GntR family transcriptional regulator